MSEKKNGGPAFPISIPGFGDNRMGGMSLRDWFAGQALAGMVSDLDGDTIESLAEGERGGRFFAKAAYALADAMLKAREA